MKAFKFFNLNMDCTMGKGIYHYEPGAKYVENEANCAKNGFHACEYIFDCLRYYGSITKSIVYLVEASGDIDEDGTDSKISCTEIELIKRLDIAEMACYAAIYIVSHPERNVTLDNTEVQVKENEASAELIAISIGEHPRARTDKDGVIVLIRKTGNEFTQAKITASKAGIWYELDMEGQITNEEEENRSTAHKES